MKEYIGFIEKCPLFSGIAEEELLKMLDCMGAVVKGYKRNEFIFRAEEKAGRIGVVLCGSIQIIREDYNGNCSINSVIAAPGIFAEAFACTGKKKFPVSAAAREECTVLFLDYGKMEKVCTEGSSFKVISNLLNIVAKKNVILDKKIEVLSKCTTREKIMTYLFSEARSRGSSSFTIPYNRQELADFLCVERSAMSAEISKLCREGVIETKKSSFRLLEK